MFYKSNLYSSTNLIGQVCIQRVLMPMAESAVMIFSITVLMLV